MDEQKVRLAIAILDEEVPRDGARVKLSQYGGGPDEGQIVANQTGYLRLGIEFLKGALPASEGDPASATAEIDLKYLVTEDSTINFDWFERRESIEHDSKSSDLNFIGLMCFAIIVAIIIFAVIGVGAAISWFAA